MASSRPIQGYEKSAEWLLEYGIELKHAALRNLVSGVAAGLDQLIRTRGRAHGNLSPATILISGPRRLARAGVALADPPGDAPASEADDLYALGLLIFRLVTHKQFDKIFDYPIDPKLFTGLRRHVDAWCYLCGRLLDLNASQRLTRLSDLVAALEEMKPRLPRPPRWLIIALVMGLAGYFIGQAVVGWRDRSALGSLREDLWFKEFARLVAQEDTRKKWEGDPTLKAIIDNCEDVGLLSGGAKRPPWELDKQVGKEQTGPWFESISLSWSGKWKGRSIRRTVDTARDALKEAKLRLGPKKWEPVTSSDPRLRALVAATIDPTRKEGIVQPAQITKVLDLKSKIPDLERALKSFDDVLGGELSMLKDRVDFGADETTFSNNLSTALIRIPAAMETVPGDSGIVTGIIKSKPRTDPLIASATLVEGFTRVCANVVKWRTDATEKQKAYVEAANSLGIKVTVSPPATQPAEGFEEACRTLAGRLSNATKLLEQVKLVRDQARKLLPAEVANVDPAELWGPVQGVTQVADAAAKVEKWWQDLKANLEAVQTKFNSVRTGTKIPENSGIDPDGTLKSDMKPGDFAAAVEGLGRRLEKLSEKRGKLNDQIAEILRAQPGDSELAELPGFMANEFLEANDIRGLDTKLNAVARTIADIHSYVVGDRKLEVDWVVFAVRRRLATTQPATSPSDRYRRWMTSAEESRKLTPDEKAEFTAMLAGWPGDRFAKVDSSIEKASTTVAAASVSKWKAQNESLLLSFGKIKDESPCQLALRDRPGELKTLEESIKQLADSIDTAIAGATGTAIAAKLAQMEFKTLAIQPKWAAYVEPLLPKDAAGIKTAEEAGRKLTDLDSWASSDAATESWSKVFQDLANDARREAAQSLLPGDWTKMAIWTGGFQDKFNSARAAYENRRVTLAALSDDWKFICQKLEAQYVTADEHKQVIEKAQPITNDSKAKLALSGNPIWKQVELLQRVARGKDRKKLLESDWELAVKLAEKLAVLRRLDALSGDSFQNSEEFDLAGQLLKDLVGKAKEDVLREVKGFWTARASKIGTLKDLESAIGSKKKFLLDDDPWFLTDKRVSAAIRHDLLLYSLKQASDKNLEEVVKKLIENGNEPPGGSALSTLKGKLKDVLNSDSATRPATAPSSQPTDAGPASNQVEEHLRWTPQNEHDGALEYTWSLPGKEPHTLFFRRVKTANGADAYLCTTEMSVGLFADIYTAGQAKWPQNEKENLKAVLNNANGVRTWQLDAQLRSITQPKQWMPKVGTFEEKYYDADFNGPKLGFRPGDGPIPQHPIQHLPPEAAARLAELLLCRLPTVIEWHAANEKMRPGVTPNMRDSMWQKQYKYVQKLMDPKQTAEPWLAAPDPSSGSYSPNPQAPGEMWHQDANGKFVVGGPGPPYDDHFLWFDKVCPEAGKATDFQHLLGNVAEFVTDKPYTLGEKGKPREEDVKLLIIGASALSAPDAKDLTSDVGALKEHPWEIYEAYSDVGFRLAFSAPPAKSPLRTFIAQAKYVLAKDATPP